MCNFIPNGLNFTTDLSSMIVVKLYSNLHILQNLSFINSSFSFEVNYQIIYVVFFKELPKTSTTGVLIFF
jgi:hypothetical protein